MSRFCAIMLAAMLPLLPMSAYAEEQDWVEILAEAKPDDMTPASKGENPTEPPPLEDVIRGTSNPEPRIVPEPEPEPEAAPAPAPAAAEPSAPATSMRDDSETKLSFQINTNYGRWKGDTQPLKSGIQALTYGSVGMESGNFGMAAHASFANTVTRYSTAARPDFSLGKPLDTVLVFYYKAPDFLGMQTRFGLDVSLPTGTPSFNNTDLAALLIDDIAADLFLAPTFGQGLNVAPNIGFVIPASERLNFGFGLRYELTGEYDPSKDITGDNYDPGDTLNIIGSMEYAVTDSSLLLLDISALYATRDKQSGSDVFKQGDAYSASMQYAVAVGDFRTTYGLSFSTQKENQSFAGGGKTTENRNSNGNVTEGFINIFAPFSSNFAGTLVVSYKSAAANGYAVGDALYDAGYSMFSGTGGLVFELMEGVALTGSVRFYQLSNKADAVETIDTTYQGYNLDVGFIYAF